MRPRRKPNGLQKFASDVDGPTIAISGAVHGNEPCGLEAVRRLSRELRDGSLTLNSGTLVLIHGNPEATLSGRRHTPGGCDLNRLFDFAFVDDTPERAWVYEHHRAIELRSELGRWHALLDLHSTGFPGPPFAILAGPEAAGLTADLGLERVVTGWHRSELPGRRALIGALARRERFALVIECGQHHDPEAAERAYHYARRFLGYWKLVDNPAAPHGAAQHYEVFDFARKPHPDYRFPRPLTGFTPLPAGEDLGYGVRVPENSVAIMPNDTVDAGDDLLYFAREVTSS